MSTDLGFLRSSDLVLIRTTIARCKQASAPRMSRIEKHQEYCQIYALRTKFASIVPSWDIFMLGATFGTTAASALLREPGVTIAGLLGSTHRFGEIIIQFTKADIHAEFNPPDYEPGYVIKLKE